MLCIAGFSDGASTQLFTSSSRVRPLLRSLRHFFCIALGSAAGTSASRFRLITTSLLAAPLGGDIDSVIWIGVIIGVALVTFGVVGISRAVRLVDGRWRMP